MIYEVCNNGILIKDVSQFNPEHILECGQVFSYKKDKDNYIVFPQDKIAKISKNDDGYFIETNDIEYFINYFDLNRDYNLIKNDLKKFSILNEPINFGYGIRILNQDLFEVLVSFIISANNNIKRIQLILNNFRNKLGVGDCEIKSFPTLKKFKECDENFFRSCGAGYRSNYLVKVFNSLNDTTLEHMKNLDTNSLQIELLKFAGIGPKVADCILLFGYKKGDVFPVDTWINKVFNKYYFECSNRCLIRKILIEEFGNLSGYAQQYLFYYQRSFDKK